MARSCSLPDCGARASVHWAGFEPRRDVADVLPAAGSGHAAGGAERAAQVARPRGSRSSVGLEKRPPNGPRRMGRRSPDPASVSKVEASKSGRRDSNPRPPEPHSGALPGCATSRISRNDNRLVLSALPWLWGLPDFHPVLVSHLAIAHLLALQRGRPAAASGHGIHSNRNKAESTPPRPSLTVTTAVPGFGRPSSITRTQVPTTPFPVIVPTP